MTHPLITRAQVDEEVRKALAASLNKSIDDIPLDASVVDDLGGTSLDFLDVNFRLEQAFGIQMANQMLLEHVEEMYGEGKAIDLENRLTQEGAELLRLRLGADPRLEAGAYADETPAVVTASTLAQSVEDILATLPEACPSCGATQWQAGPAGLAVECGKCGKAAEYVDGDELTRRWVDAIEAEKHLFGGS